MNTRYHSICALILCAVSYASGYAQVGQPWIHDPSTLAECEGKYYTFGTGGGGLISEDGYHWHGGGVRPGGGAAPDVLKIGDRYLIIYGTTGGGLGGGHKGQILTMWNETLDPSSPQFGYTDPIEVVASDSNEDNDAIDPGLLLDPTTGRLWFSYGTYFGATRLAELNPKTGQRMDGNRVKDIAIDCEATDLIYRQGWYYLLGTHGTCCDGVNSTYNIVCGRSLSVEGPYIDNVGRSMLEGGGKMVIHAGHGMTGPGHFGRTVVDKGVEVMTCHFEADYGRSGRSVLAIRPLLWKNDWPVAGEPFREGVYSIESERRGYALELRVDFIRQELGHEPFWKIDPNTPVKALPKQHLDEVQSTWPSGNIGVGIGDYMFRPHQQWSITAVDEAGGYLGSPYYKICIEGSDRALTATADHELTAAPHYTGAPEQLWRIEQCTDGTYRLMPKHIPGGEEENHTYVLYSAGDSTPTLAPWDFESDNAKWAFKGAE